MVFQAAIGVEAGMNERQMIAFAIVLDRKLLVRFNLQLEC